MKKNINKIVFIVVFVIFSFFPETGIIGFTLINNYELPTVIPERKIIGENEAFNVKEDRQRIDAILNAKVKYIEFSDSKQYDREREIVYKITNMVESEKYSEGSMKKAFIRIALEDLNSDGAREILAYIEQFEWCGKGGGYCTFLVLQKSVEEDWREVFRILTYRDIGILSTKTYGYSDIVFRNIILKVSNKEKIKDRQEITVWRWNGKRYESFIKRKIVYDIKTNREKSIIWKWDEKSNSWSSIEEHK